MMCLNNFSGPNVLVHILLLKQINHWSLVDTNNKFYYFAVKIEVDSHPVRFQICDTAGQVIMTHRFLFIKFVFLEMNENKQSLIISVMRGKVK